MTDEEIKAKLKEVANKALNREQAYVEKRKRPKGYFWVWVFIFSCAGAGLYYNYGMNQTEKLKLPRTRDIEKEKKIIRNFYNAINNKNVSKLEPLLGDKIIRYNEWVGKDKFELVNLINNHFEKTKFESDSVNFESLSVQKDVNKTIFKFISYYKFKAKNNSEGSSKRRNEIWLNLDMKIDFYNSWTEQ